MGPDDIRSIREKYTFAAGRYPADVVSDIHVLLAMLSIKSGEQNALRQANKEAVALAEGMADEVERLRATLEEFADTGNWTVSVQGTAIWIGDFRPWTGAEKALRPPKIAHVFHVTGDGVEMSCRFTEQWRADEFERDVLQDSGLTWTKSEVEE